MIPRKCRNGTGFCTFYRGVWSSKCLEIYATLSKNDSLHLVYLSTDASLLLPADAGLSGQAVPSNGGVLNSGVTLTAELWGGTVFEHSCYDRQRLLRGRRCFRHLAPTEHNPAFCGWSGEFYQVLVYGANAGSYAVASTSPGYYYGQSPIFTCTSGSGIAYNSIVKLDSPSFSTWAIGEYALDNVIPGAKGAIVLQTVPSCPPRYQGMGCRCRRANWSSRDRESHFQPWCTGTTMVILLSVA